MKREILFRGKSINSGEWVESMTISKGAIKRKKDCVFMELSEGMFVCVIPETVGQLIFILNGHKYFEGDIIGMDRNNVRYVLLWNKENQCFSIFSSYDVKFINGNDDLLTLNILSNREQVMVTFLKKYNFYPVGNIYDNPELLKQEQNDK